MNESAGTIQVAQHERAKLGMWLFLASEVMFFGGFIASYIVLRMSNPEICRESQKELNWVLAMVNTVALITSSWTMALGVSAAGRGDRPRTLTYLFLTMSLGLVFLGLKGIEYAAKFSHHIYPSSNVFFSCYFTMTGFHALHVLVGIVVLWSLFWLILAGARARQGDTYPTPVETAGLYWHLVDIVWIFLFPILYLL